MNRWNIPKILEVAVRTKDTRCVYCGVKFSTDKTDRKNTATWEHIINDETIITPENIALCCGSCNASNGTKLLEDWINSAYCVKKNINYHTVAKIIKASLTTSNN